MEIGGKQRPVSPRSIAVRIARKRTDCRPYPSPAKSRPSKRRLSHSRQGALYRRGKFREADTVAILRRRQRRQACVFIFRAGWPRWLGLADSQPAIAPLTALISMTAVASERRNRSPAGPRWGAIDQYGPRSSARRQIRGSRSGISSWEWWCIPLAPSCRRPDGTRIVDRNRGQRLFAAAQRDLAAPPTSAGKLRPRATWSETSNCNCNSLLGRGFEPARDIDRIADRRFGSR